MGIPLLSINGRMVSAILFMPVLVLNYVVNDGGSNRFGGAILLTSSIVAYIIFAITLWYYPFVALQGTGPPPRVCSVDEEELRSVNNHLCPRDVTKRPCIGFYLRCDVFFNLEF